MTVNPKVFAGKVTGCLEAVEHHSHHPKVGDYWVYRCLLCESEGVYPICVVNAGIIQTHDCTRWEYDRWRGARKRVSEKSPQKTRKTYFENGVVMSPEFDDFLVFLSEVGPLPGQECALDRIDPFGDYAPGNVRWLPLDHPDSRRRNDLRFWWNGEYLTCAEHARRSGIQKQTLQNRFHAGKSPEEIMAPVIPNTRELTHDGKTMSMSAWARVCGFKDQSTISRRLGRGMTVEDALTIPSGKNPKSGYKPEGTVY